MRHVKKLMVTLPDISGEIHDGITDMYYLMARYYTPDTGRFTQADTYHEDVLNLYVYAGNNPIKYVDPSGHDKQSNVEILAMAASRPMYPRCQEIV